LISHRDVAEFSQIFHSQAGQEFIKEIVFDQRGGHLIFNIIGFVSLKLSNDEVDPLGTLIFASSRVDFSSGIWYLLIFYFETSIIDIINLDVQISTKPAICVFPGKCAQNLIIKKSGQALSAAESTKIFDFMRHVTMANFETENEQYLRYIEHQAKILAPFLPSDFTSFWK